MGVNQRSSIGRPGRVLPNDSAQSPGRTAEDWDTPKLARGPGALHGFDEKFGSIPRDVQKEKSLEAAETRTCSPPEVDICVMPLKLLEVEFPLPRYSREPSVPASSFGRPS